MTDIDHDCFQHLVRYTEPMPKNVKRRKPRFCSVCWDIFILRGHRGPYIPLGQKLKVKGQNVEVHNEEVPVSSPSELPESM